MKKLPIGLQRFRKIILDDYVYVDKTRQIYNIIEQGNLYFLSRPRRFGKSLLISTLKEIFEGNKELFEGLFIAEHSKYNWESFPVLQFNFAKLGYQVQNLDELLLTEIDDKASTFGIALEKIGLSQKVEELVSKLSQKKGEVVFLVDEYDKPIIDFFGDKQQVDKNRTILREFFSPLKYLEEKGSLRFLFITGVSKFSRVSVFSDLNNLTDLTLDPISNDLLGITQEELLNYFTEHIEASVNSLKMSKEELLRGVQLWYDGYSYDGETFLYNPFSLLNFFRKNRFGNFWFETGTPTFLVETIRDKKIRPEEIENKEVKEVFFSKFTIEQLDMHGLLFQTGYLTIKETRRKKYELYYKLGYPNEEVRHAFIHNLLEAYSYQPASIVGNALVGIEKALEEGMVNEFVHQLKILLSDISYHLHPKDKKHEEKAFEVWEGYFHTIIYLITSFLGLSVQSEIAKHQGRLDLSVETDRFHYLMEFKLDGSAENAIEQIESKKYFSSYLNSPKRLILVGVGFSKEERNVDSWMAKEWAID